MQAENSVKKPWCATDPASSLLELHPIDYSAPQVARFPPVRLFCGVGSGLREELKSTTGIWREKMTMLLGAARGHDRCNLRSRVLKGDGKQLCVPSGAP